MRLVLVVLLAIGGVAVAQPKADVQKAAALYDKGKRHFDIAEYSAAVAAWKEAYLLSSEPLLLFNIAQAHRLAGDCGQANRFYLNYKRVQPKPPNQAELDSAMKKCAGIAPATGDNTPTVTSPPPPEPTPVEPPSPTPIPTPTPTEQPVAPPPYHDAYVNRGRTMRLTGLAVGGAGVVAGVIGVLFAFEAKSKADDVESQKTDTAWNSKLDALEADGKSAQTRSRILGVVGIAAIATGGALYWYGRSKSSVKVDIAVTPHHSQVSLTCAF